MSNRLDPDLAQQIVGPDLGPNCLPRLSADGNAADSPSTVIEPKNLESTEPGRTESIRL